MAGCNGLQSTIALGGDCLISIFSILIVRFNLSSDAIDAKTEKSDEIYLNRIFTVKFNEIC